MCANFISCLHGEDNFSFINSQAGVPRNPLLPQDL